MQTRPVTPRRESAQGGARSTGVNTAASERRRGVRPPGQNPPAPSAPAAPEKPGRFSLRSWRVRNRLFLLVCFPLLIAIGVAATRVNTLYADRSHYANVRFQATTVATVENLLLAMQQERQAAAICLADDQGAPCTATNKGSDGNGVANYQQLQFDQKTTDAALADLTASANTVAQGNSYAQTLRDATVEAVGRTNDLAAIRTVVTQSAAPYTVTYNAYTSVIEDVLKVVANAGAGAADQAVTQDESALSALSQMIEAESQSSAITAQVITLGQAISPAIVQGTQATTLQNAQATYQSSLVTFQNTATPALVQSFDTTVSGPEVAGSTAGATAALAVLQAKDSHTAYLANDGNLTSTVLDADLPVTIGDLRTVQAAAIAQLQNDAQALLDSADNDLYLNIGVIVVALLLSFIGTVLVARSLTRPLSLLRAAALDIAATRLPEMVRRLRDADAVTADADSRVEPIPITSSDEIGEVARSFDEVHQQAVRLASEQAMLRANVNSMFVNLSRRSQSLVQRQLRLIDELENSEQDPDQLANLFKLDHLATRMRRNGENLLVLAGEEPGRKWSQAVRLLDVLRAGASEVEQYERVQLRDLPDTNVVGRVVNDLVHLVAELLENATSFSAPETRVTVTANTLNTGGVMLEIEDSGIGMTPEELDDANERLANPPVIDVAISRRMGLYVVGRLATRHGIQVRLRRSAGGGITALVLVPSSLLAGIENEQAPATELSATGVRSLGALPRRGGGAEFPTFGEADPLASSQGGRGGLGEQQFAVEPGVSDTAGRSLGAIPGARTPMDEQSGTGLATPPVGPPVNPFAAPREPEPQLPSGPAFPESPSLPAAPFGAEPALPQNPQGAPFGGPGADALGQSGLTPMPPAPANEAPFGGAPLPQRGAPAPAGGEGAGFGQQPPAPAQPPANPFQAAPRADLNLDATRPQQFQQLPPQPPVPPPPAAPVQPAGDPLGSSNGPQVPPAPPARQTESTGQLPRIRDVGNTGQFPVVPPAPAPAAPLAVPQQQAAPAQQQQPAPQRASDDTAQFRLNPGPGGRRPAAAGADPNGSGEYSVAERLFAADPLPPAPATDERLPIFEAMESEWFRRRDEARAQAQSALSAGGAAPLPPAPAPAPLPAAPQAPALPTAEPTTSTPPPLAQPAAPAAPAAGSTTSPAAPSAPPTPPAPAVAAPTSAGDMPMESPVPSRQPAPGQEHAPQGANSASWSSPGDEGWRAAQAAAKPVAAGLTQKGLPKRVPKSNLVPGSAGGTGAAKAAPPLPPRSAEEVRGKLSSFHRGLRQGRDAATGQENPEGER